MFSSYVNFLNHALVPGSGTSGKVLDLFAGCGGLALGFEAAGFQTIGYEMDEAAVATYCHNLAGTCYKTFLTTDHLWNDDYDVVIGGPPCQPFSVGGYQHGVSDPRNGFPVFVEAVKQVRPKLFLFENVRGMLYENKWYLEKLVKELEVLGYQVAQKLVNAVHYGVPQNRERLVCIGVLGSMFEFPTPDTVRVSAGEAVGDLIGLPFDARKLLTPSMDKYVLKYEIASKCINPRDLHLDRPSRTVTCRNLSGSTGDMMRVKLADGRRRRLTVREAARLQSFPDRFEFQGTETQQFNQIGNAVPPLLAYRLAIQVHNCLQSQSKPAYAEAA